VDVEDGDDVARLGAKSAEKLDDELLVGDWGVDIAKGVGKDLQLAAVLHNGAIVLEQLVELLSGVDGALQTVVEEEVGYRW
jgi:hypothetical protein